MPLQSSKHCDFVCIDQQSFVSWLLACEGYCISRKNDKCFPPCFSCFEGAARQLSIKLSHFLERRDGRLLVVSLGQLELLLGLSLEYRDAVMRFINGKKKTKMVFLNSFSHRLAYKRIKRNRQSGLDLFPIILVHLSKKQKRKRKLGFWIFLIEDAQGNR